MGVNLEPGGSEWRFSMKKIIIFVFVALFALSGGLWALDWSKKDWMDSRRECMLETQGSRAKVAKLYLKLRRADSQEEKDNFRAQIKEMCPKAAAKIPKK
jgi:hypothetical protein